MAKLNDEASKVSAMDGKVILHGPGGVDVELTPDAALETADRLVDGSVKALGQKRMADAHALKHKPS